MNNTYYIYIIHINFKENSDGTFNNANNYKNKLYTDSLHNGSADSGHYTTLFKVNKNLIEFDEGSSRIITEDELKVEFMW